MSGVIKGALVAAILAGSTVAATAPAQADRGTGALLAGIAGIAIGAAIASDHPHGRYRTEPIGYDAPPPATYAGYGYAPAYGYDRGYGYGYGYGWDRGRGYGDHGRGWGDGYRR